MHNFKTRKHLIKRLLLCGCTSTISPLSCEKKARQQEKRARAVKQERLEIKEQCFIYQRVCLSSVTYNGRGRPSAHRGLYSPISRRLHLVLKQNRVRLQSERGACQPRGPREGYQTPELAAAPGAGLGFLAAEMRPAVAVAAASAPTRVLIRLPPRQCDFNP